METKFLTILKLLLISFSFVTPDFLQSQITEEWVRRYNGTGNSGDKAYSIALDASGNTYVTGYSISQTYTDCVTIKYNNSGIQQWVQRHDGTGNHIDEGHAVVTDAAGNVYVTGFSAGFGTAEDFIIIKYNSAGVMQWTKYYNGPLSFVDRGTAITVGESGNVYVTGKSGGSTGNDYATIKYNSSGTLKWVQRYNGTGNGVDDANAIAIDANENVYVTGVSSASLNNGDYATIKYDSAGNFKWIQRYDAGTNTYDEAISMVISGKYIYVTGHSMGNGTGYDFATIKYDTSGNQQWVQRYNSGGNIVDEGNSIIVDHSGNVFVTGYSLVTANNYDTRTIKYNSSGVMQWTKTYAGSGNNGFDEGSSLATDASGNVYVSGRSTGNLTNQDYAIIKYDSAGVQKWVKRYDGPGSGEDAPTSIAIDASGNLYVTGGSNGDTTSSDYATIKYSQTIGINVLSNEIPQEFYLSQNYPNPFNPSTKLKFQIPELSNVEITVFDVLGKSVETLVSRQLQAGTYEADWDASNYPGGIYFYRLVSDGFIGTKKMILLK